MFEKKKKRWGPFLEFTQGFRNTRDLTKNKHKTTDVENIAFILI